MLLQQTTNGVCGHINIPTEHRTFQLSQKCKNKIVTCNLEMDLYEMYIPGDGWMDVRRVYESGILESIPGLGLLMNP